MADEKASATPAPARPFYRRVSDVIRDPSIWEHIPRAEIDALIDTEIVIVDAMFLQGNMGENPGDFCVFLAHNPDDPEDQFTSMTGGAVFVSKLKRLAAAGEFPILGTLTARRSRTGKYATPYYDIQ